MKKSVAAHCPYCGNMINYFYLYDAKRSDFGYCSHCGGMYGVKYSPLAYMLVMGALGALVGGFAFWYLANKTLPGAGYLTICTVVITTLYFLMPLLITPRRVIVRGRLGGFPSPEYIPVHRRDRNRATRKLVIKNRSEVLYPEETNTESSIKQDNTSSDNNKPSGRRERAQEAKRLRRETVKKSLPKRSVKTEKNTDRKHWLDGTKSIIEGWGKRIGAWGGGVKTALNNVGAKLRAWGQGAFRKRAKRKDK